MTATVNGFTVTAMELPCGRCDHQNGAHTRGADPDGWPIYDRTWNEALGECSAVGCNCPGRVDRKETAVNSEPTPEPTALDEILAEQLKAAIIHDVENKPRSLQRALGPSEIGEPCQRKLAYKLLDWDPKPNTNIDPLPSFIGTAAHEAMANALEKVNDHE